MEKHKDLIDFFENDIMKKGKRIMSNSKQALSFVYGFKKGLYDFRKGLGYETINDLFFVYKETGPYTLLDDDTGNKYKFDSAKIGLELFIENEGIKIRNPQIINKYTHPTLLYENKAFQKISIGNNKYYKNNDISKIIIRILLEYEKAMKRYDERYCTYAHILSSPIFDKYKIE